MTITLKFVEYMEEHDKALVGLERLRHYIQENELDELEQALNDVIIHLASTELSIFKILDQQNGVTKK